MSVREALFKIGLLVLWFGILEPAPAFAWSDFYNPVQRSEIETARPKRAAASPESVCISEILAAQERHGIPENLLLGLGLQEAGTNRNGVLTVWPYAVNSEGRGRIFDSQDAALRFVEKERRDGAHSIDVGCMQINLRWHPDAFPTVQAGFDPALNVEYAARFLRRLYEESGDWRRALGNYHSRTPEKRARYTQRALRNIAVANERIETFRALASRSPGARREQTRPRPEARRVRTLWSTRAAGTDTRFTPYGRYTLQPILPILVRGS